jgi:hypothetical protein
MNISDLFDFKTGQLPALEKTENGTVPLVYGSTYNNGIAKFVEVDDADQIFHPPLITVSYLGTAFVQLVDFTTSIVDKSNIIVLAPKTKMSLEELYFYAFQINRAARFGFHYGRRMNMRQLGKLEVQKFDNGANKIDFHDLLPNIDQNREMRFHVKMNSLNFKEYPITQLFELIRGDFHSLASLDSGTMPTVSRTSYDNGIMGYFRPPDDATVYHAGYLTISAVSGDAFFQLHDFIATDNIIICKPRHNFRVTTLVFMQFMLKRQKWRYSYGRQCYKTKFSNSTIFLPTHSDGSVDEDKIEYIVKNTSYWKYIESHFTMTRQLTP